jgi:hypothetical protein
MAQTDHLTHDGHAKHDGSMSETKPPAVVSTLADLQQYLTDLHSRWAADPEDGHSRADQISRRVLELTAEGHPDAAAMAAAVLTIYDWDVDWWYA